MNPYSKLPLVYSCSGASTAAQMANAVAIQLDRLRVAEMSCIAGLGGDVKPLVRKAQSGRPIIVLDGCPLRCAAHILKRHGLVASKSYDLSTMGVKKRYHEDFDPAEADRTLDQIRRDLAATRRIRRNNRAAEFPTDLLACHKDFSNTETPDIVSHPMSHIVPLISSSLAGPLGIKHLPRLWQKVSLAAVGKLHPDYPAIGQGYDAMVLKTLDIAPEKFEKFIRDEKPSYTACEKWVAANGKLDAAAIAALNRQIDQYHHKDDVRDGILGTCGLSEDAALYDAPTLNNLDDWATFHKEVLS